jgi:hypothetical protein
MKISFNLAVTCYSEIHRLTYAIAWKSLDDSTRPKATKSGTLIDTLQAKSMAAAIRKSKNRRPSIHAPAAYWRFILPFILPQNPR